MSTKGKILLSLLVLLFAGSSVEIPKSLTASCCGGSCSCAGENCCGKPAGLALSARDCRPVNSAILTSPAKAFCVAQSIPAITPTAERSLIAPGDFPRAHLCDKSLFHPPKS